MASKPAGFIAWIGAAALARRVRTGAVALFTGAVLLGACAGPSEAPTGDRARAQQCAECHLTNPGNTDVCIQICGTLAPLP